MKKTAMILLAIMGGFLSERAIWADQPIALVPRPLQMERKAGEFTLNHDTAILVDEDSTDAANVGRLLAERIRRSTGLDLTMAPLDCKADAHNAILLTAEDANTALGAEGYTLDVTSDRVSIIATDGSGLFHGAISLLQLLPPNVFSPTTVDNVAWVAPAVHIEDRPRFAWRGLVVDPTRHFLKKEEIKDFIDLMAQHKFNTLQLHLTDDEGWRIEIKQYPKLTEIGAWRKDADIAKWRRYHGQDPSPKDGAADGSDGRYGGLYTQDDIREIVAYAKARYITVVPEIEMPGHAGAMLSVYPEFSCSGEPFDRDSGLMGICCPGNEATFTFLQNILAEVAELFPAKHIHIGGDEVDQTNWKKCSKCQARMRREGLKDENALHGYFMRRIKSFLEARNCTTVGWDEVESRQDGIAPYSIVMSWRSVEAGVLAAEAGINVIMMPASHTYFDYYQAISGEPKAIGGFLPLTTVYDFEPILPAVSANKVKHILGASAGLWSEFFPNYAHVQYMAYPRACALAEVTWTDPKLKNWEDFAERLDTHLQRLTVQEVNYRRP